MRELHVEPRMRWARPGTLDVFVDGRLVFSKKQAGRMPTTSEILAAVRRT